MKGSMNESLASLEQWLRRFPALGDLILVLEKEPENEEGKLETKYRIDKTQIVTGMIVGGTGFEEVKVVAFSNDNSKFSAEYFEGATEDFSQLLQLPVNERKILPGSFLEKIADHNLTYLDYVKIELWDGQNREIVQWRFFDAMHRRLRGEILERMGEIGIPHAHEEWYRILPRKRT